MGRKIVLFELNEVPGRIVDEYCRWYPEAPLSRVLRGSSRYETATEDIGSLSPWITWPSLHRGVSNEKHFLMDFGQNTDEVDKVHPPIWEILASNGISTGVCGSLHTYPLPSDLSGYSFFLPDTFAAGAECFPEVLETFQEFNLNMARESARNVSMRVPWASALRLLAKVPELGFKAKTALEIGTQLVDERLHPERRVRRRTYQSVLAFDVFMRQLERSRPAFSTFFTNHVASAMHRYWAAAFPGDYQTVDYTDEWIGQYKNEIRFAMAKADQFLTRLVAFVDRNPEYTIWIATSMGQKATRARPVETQLYATDLDKLMAAFGFGQGQWERRPAMLPSFNVVVAQERRQELANAVRSLVIAGKSTTYREGNSGFISIDFGQDNLDPSAPVELFGRPVTLASVGLANVEIHDRSGTSAYHIPQGCLFIYDPREQAPKATATQQVSTLDIAPSILRNFGVEVPSYMRAPTRLAGGGDAPRSIISV